MDANDKRCDHCRTGVALRRYCRACSPRASALYKRNERREAKAAGERYWLDWWAKAYGDAALLKRREYQRQYMRSYRGKQRAPKRSDGAGPRGSGGLAPVVPTTPTSEPTPTTTRRTAWTHSN